MGNVITNGSITSSGFGGLAHRKSKGRVWGRRGFSLSAKSGRWAVSWRARRGKSEGPPKARHRALRRLTRPPPILVSPSLHLPHPPRHQPATRSFPTISPSLFLSNPPSTCLLTSESTLVCRKILPF